MKRVYSLLLIFLCSLILFAGGEAETSVDAAGYQVVIAPGEYFRHPFPLFLGIKLKNPPQMALWAESLDGDYLGTLMVTEKTAGQKWAKAPKDSTPKDEIRRPEALPVWSHRSGAAWAAPDAVSRATPKGSFTVDLPGHSRPERYYLYFEVNHSTDFNSAYPADAEPGEANYNGGRWGGGQPALVYRLLVDPALGGMEQRRFELVGRSSPAGRDGQIYPDLAGIDSALEIVAAVYLEQIQE